MTGQNLTDDVRDGPPARLLVTATARPEVEYRTFILRDPEAFGSPLEATPESPDDPSTDRGRAAQPGPGGVVLSTGGNDFYPAVTVEAWSGPPPLEGEWDLVEEVRFTAPSGTVQVRDLQNAPAGPVLELGPPGDYRVRVCSRGRADAAARIGEELYYDGVEHWLLQLWPA